MENIQDYLGKKVLIQINNKQEYKDLLPHLNTVFKGWQLDSFESYMHEARLGCFWIMLDKDMMTRTIDDEVYESIMQASEFIESKEPEVINNYNIY